MKTKLTMSAIDKIKSPAKGRIVLRDTATPGLTAVVTANGARTFYAVRWGAGRVRWVRLGPVGELTVDKARSMARQANSDIADGIDPNAVKRQDRNAAVLQDLWDAYAAVAKTRPRTWTDYEATWRRYLSPWARRRLTEIGKNDVRKLHGKIAEGKMDRDGEEGRVVKGGPVAANRALALLSIIYNAVGEDFGISINPVRGVKRLKEAPRERFLNDAEIGPFLKAVDALHEPLAKDFIRMALFTGQRRSNLQAMAWDDISIPFATWTIERGEMKGGRGHVVPLVPQALEILQRRRDADPDGVWVFATSSASGHIEEPKKAITAAATAAGIAELSTHDLRRTCATWCNSTGASEGTIAALLAHKRQNVTGAVYVKVQIDAVRTALGKAVDAMLAAAGATQVVTVPVTQVG